MDYKSIYKSLYLIRKVEEEIVRIYPTDKIKSPVHLSIGQEAVSVGVCEALKHDDAVFGTYRGHALYLAKGGDLKRMIAELYGKVTGCARGKGGSMHLIDVENGVMGMSAVVATTIPEAVGYAYAMKTRGINAVVASFFGDGAVDEGTFHESINFAKLKELPVLFICENNLYAIHSPPEDRHHLTDLCGRASSYGVPASKIEDNDVLEIYKQVNEAVEQMRSDDAGPFFFECMTYRWKAHVGPDDDIEIGYRSAEEVQAWMDDDQVERMAEMLTKEDRAEIEKSVDQDITEAFEFAEQSEFPDPSELYQAVFQ
jgi:TPP-dependent pyruvate/acetoin dehydrogenase alpha subunit